MTNTNETDNFDSRLIVVSNRLPFIKSIDDRGQEKWEQATGGLVSALDPVLRQTNGVWVGWEGYPNDDFSRDHFSLTDIRDLGLTKNLWGVSEGHYYIANVPLTTDEIDEYYTRFSNSTLWSLFHYFFEKSSIDIESWETYFSVNNRFANYINKISKPNDTIWIHDYQLFLVPLFLRKMRPDQNINFFLHIPFPHSDILSILPWKDQILESLLACNSVGVHHPQYKRNILASLSDYHREKKIKASVFKSQLNNTNFYVNPISIDYERWNKASMGEEVETRCQEIKKQNNSRKLILGVDRLDYSKGIKERFLALEYLLDNNPEYSEQFSYYQLAVPSREAVGAYKQLKREIDEIVGRINGKFSTGSWSPIHYMYNNVSYHELVSFYKAADIALVTPLRDGMNLVCKEFIAAHSDEDGILILSKFAGAIAQIKNAIAVNPYSIAELANALDLALKMTEKERKSRMKKLRNNIKSNSIHDWLNNCIYEFKQ